MLEVSRREIEINYASELIITNRASIEHERKRFQKIRMDRVKPIWPKCNSSSLRKYFTPDSKVDLRVLVLTDGVLAKKLVSAKRCSLHSGISGYQVGFVAVALPSPYGLLLSPLGAIFQDQNNSDVSPEAACEAANAIGAVVDAPWQGADLNVTF